MNQLLMANNKQITNICEENDIEYLALFGSYSRNENTENSDIDLLVRFSKPVGYFKLTQIESDLEKYLGKKVDLVTEMALSVYIKPYVQKDLKVLYATP